MHRYTVSAVLNAFLAMSGVSSLSVVAQQKPAFRVFMSPNAKWVAVEDYQNGGVTLYTPRMKKVKNFIQGLTNPQIL
jgi:hypothetical protein